MSTPRRRVVVSIGSIDHIILSTLLASKLARVLFCILTADEKRETDGRGGRVGIKMCMNDSSAIHAKDYLLKG